MDRYGQKTSTRQIFLTVALILAAVFVLYQLFLRSPTSEAEQVQKAVVVLKGSSVSGTVTFEQITKDGPVTVSGTVQNLDPSSLRGFHIHQLGDLTEGCLSTGSHFNPLNQVHGARTGATRHVGDLGNIVSDEHGTATFTFTDDVISLNGPKSILGLGGLWSCTRAKMTLAEGEMKILSRLATLVGEPPAVSSDVVE